MRLTFRLRFHTRYGQALSLLMGSKGFGPGETVIPLEYLNWEFWQGTVEVKSGKSAQEELRYHYILSEADGSTVHEGGKDRVITPTAFKANEVLIIDSWNDAAFYENAFYTEPFLQVLLKPNQTELRTTAATRVTHTFKVKAPLLAASQTLCLLGDTAALGNWDVTKPVLLGRRKGEEEFSISMDLAAASYPVSYKYAVYDLEKEQFLRYEEGANRILYDAVTTGKETLVNDGFAVLPSNTWKGAGVAVPVFSLRSEASFGVGEFSDLKLLADWCRKTGLKLIQILPVNDTTATHTVEDSYPYAAISAFALHPIYLNLSRVVDADHQYLLSELEGEQKRLNALPSLDYLAVIKAKLGFLKQIYAAQKKATFASEQYHQFFERNRDWLEPYAAFCYSRDTYGTPDFSQWPAHRRYVAEQIAQMARENPGFAYEIGFHCFVQFHLHLQLKEASEYAHARGVVLKGDIPIGVSRYGADVWQQPEQFHLDMQAGAPPDAFGLKGQNWSFPTYNWPRMMENGFGWWKRRFAQMGEYFDAFRIDHILGFFRIWSIPMHAIEGILGYFVPALPVAADEFGARGIPFDPERYAEPYVNDKVLRAVFGTNDEQVKSQFLIPEGEGNYRLRPQFQTQRQVERYFAALESNAQNRRLKQGLFDLISEVILLEEPGSRGERYHFRFGIEKTGSFMSLSPPTRERLWDLYQDYFYKRQDDFWSKEALQKLPALKRVTNMLVCGEDLGMVPDCVPTVMRQLGLLSLEVQRMPKALNQEFFRPLEAPYLSVVTTGTHDMRTLRGWWQEDRAVTQKFFNRELGQPGKAPAECEPWISRTIVAQHLASPAMWSIFPIQDLLGMDEQLRRKNPEEERINVPADPKNQWQYRLHLSLETMMQAARYNEGLMSMVRKYGRDAHKECTK